MAELLGITGVEALAVVISTVAMYFSLLVLVRLLGQRSLTNLSSFDFGAVVAIGAVLGRAALLNRPTLAGGVLVLLTLFSLQLVVGRLRLNRRVDHLINRPPVLLMAGSRLLTENLRRTQVVDDELRQVLRLAGIRQLSEVASVILERNGRISVTRRGSDIDPWLLADVDGHELVPGDHLPGLQP